MQKRHDFEMLKQEPGMTVSEYVSKFLALGRFSPDTMNDEESKMVKFESGLNPRIRTWLVNVISADFEALVDAYYRIEKDIIRRDATVGQKRGRDTSGDKGARKMTRQNFHGRQGRQQNQNQRGNQNREQRRGQNQNNQRNNQGNQGQQQQAIPMCPHCQKNHLGECYVQAGSVLVAARLVI